MGEYVSAGFRVSGRLLRRDIPELIELLKDKDMKTDDDKDPTADNIGEAFISWEVNYGNLDDLVQFCALAGLDYEVWNGSGSWGAGSMTRCRNGEAVDFHTAEDNGLPCVPIEELIRTDALATGWADLHRRIRLFLEPLPDAEIVDG